MLHRQICKSHCWAQRDARTRIGETDHGRRAISSRIEARNRCGTTIEHPGIGIGHETAPSSKIANIYLRGQEWSLFHPRKSRIGLDGGISPISVIWFVAAFKILIDAAISELVEAVNGGLQSRDVDGAQVGECIDAVRFEEKAAVEHCLGGIARPHPAERVARSMARIQDQPGRFQIVADHRLGKAVIVTRFIGKPATLRVHAEAEGQRTFPLEKSRHVARIEKARRPPSLFQKRGHGPESPPNLPEVAGIVRARRREPAIDTLMLLSKIAMRKATARKQNASVRFNSLWLSITQNDHPRGAAVGP